MNTSPINYDSIKHGHERQLEQHNIQLPQHLRFKKPRTKPTVDIMIKMMANTLIASGIIEIYSSYSDIASLLSLIL